MATPEMVEREEPRFVQFGAGDFVQGLLVSIDRVMVKDKPCVRYTVREENGLYAQFIGTHQLNTKLRVTDKGHYVDIRCEGEDAMVRRGENCMKVFTVLVSKEKAKDSDVFITDDDIPF